MSAVEKTTEAAVTASTKSNLFNKKFIIAGITSLSLGGIICYYLTPYLKRRRIKNYIEHHNLNKNCFEYLDIFQSQAISPLVRSILKHILVADNFLNPNELYLPEFKEQTNHLMKQIGDSYTGGKFLLLEGCKGNGKGYALRAWAKKEKRICIYLGLKQSFRKSVERVNIPSNEISSSIDPYATPSPNPTTTADAPRYLDDTTSATALDNLSYSSLKEIHDNLFNDLPERSLFVFGLLEAFGFFSIDTFSDPQHRPTRNSIINSLNERKQYLHPRLLSEAFKEIETVLQYICLRSNTGPVLFILDDIQLLFNEQELVGQYDCALTILQWLLKCQKNGLMDMIFCSSERSVITCVKKLKGFEKFLTTKVAEDVETSKVEKYLLHDVNKLLDDKFKFTKDSAQDFAHYFSSNFEEIENYCKSKIPVKKYIELRKEDYKTLVQQFFDETPGFELYPAFVDPYSTPPKDILKDLILEIMMNCVLSLDNVLPARNGDAKKWAFVQNMINHKLLRWVPMLKKRPVQHMPRTSYTYIPSIDTSLLGGDNDENSTNYWQTISSSNNWKDDVIVQSEQYPLDLDLTFYNPFIREILEQWFNQEL
ncbi:hypothetical protein BCR32DRAFT_285771 [Anaeromyces robustus]|jgi:hypothetical protein|uniref:Uncharacterized protein n=1 Tax=Anaeromyces robustus TaxID=1754192 RepID=A0A1Y1WG62_9FUNG|nr:hypothetical protein BCR32DRAFT_285771 [Anaeromyces robustus]|eukprot:ORX72523.1 hypothetical protein BCR32DRAFT_285771 [Anaeromyces robustus]